MKNANESLISYTYAINFGVALGSFMRGFFVDKLVAADLFYIALFSFYSLLTKNSTYLYRPTNI